MTTFAAVFVYEVSPGGRSAFEAAYGPEGDWARFFRGAEGYLGTELWHGVDGATSRYLVVDRWRAASAYAAFLAANDDEYERRGRAAEVVWLTEAVVGRFDVP